ncbi:MAG: hypothetical protein M3P04_01910 [Actinomycetota bacterium]|nr:hypothetical protein [Actinomycetota bacterium]
MTEVTIIGQVGPQSLSDGAGSAFRQGKTGEQAVTELHGRFFEQNYRGNLFSGGMGMTSISNATYTTATLTSSATPIVGVWNPATSLVNLVLLQAVLSVSQTALQATGFGGLVWAMSTGNTAISTGAAPLNRKTLALSGSSAKDLTNTTPTGLTNNPVVRFASALGGGSAIGAAFLATQAGAQTQQIAHNVEDIDGSIIVPPGGLLILMSTLTAVAHSAASSLLWEEVAL